MAEVLIAPFCFMANVTIDYILGDALMHAHVAGDISDLTTTLDTGYLKLNQTSPQSITGLSDGFLKLTGGVLGTGTVDLSAYLPLAGGTMAGAIAMGSNKITGLAAATANGDAVRYEQLHSAVTLGTNTATALSLSGQQLSIGDVFLQNSGDVSTGTLQIGTSPATYLYTTGVIDAGLRLTLATNPGISREGVGGVVSNIWVGVAKPSGLTTAYQNTFVAPDSGATTAGQNLTSGFKNFGLGAGSLYNLGTGFSNISIGIESSASITSGGGNIGIGPQVFYGANPNNATAIGQFAAYNLLTGYGVYIGDRAGYSQQYGFHCTNVGDYSGYSNNAGSDNTHVGWYSGYNMTGNRNVTLGAFAGNNAAFAGLDDRLIIANSTTATPLIYGNFSTAILTLNGGMVVNEQGGDYDTRIEGDTATQLLVTDASADSVEIGTTTQGVIAKFTATEVNINDTGLSTLDFRVEGDTDANLLFTDASADTVQVGASTASDSAKFYVSGKISASGEVEINGDLNHDGSNIGFFGVTPTTRQTELTDELTTITYTAPSTPDYAVQDFVDVSLGAGWAFANHEEANSVLSVVANLQTRVNELETKLVAYGLLQDAD